MGFAFDQLSRYMLLSKDVNRALLIGSESLNLVYRPDDLFNNVVFGETACAVILEKTNDLSKMIDTKFCVETDKIHCVAGPNCGLSNVFTKPKEEWYYRGDDTEMNWNAFANDIKEMIQEHGLNLSDIKLFCVSQAVKPEEDELFEALGVAESQKIYVGDRFGYTGSNSTFLCLHEALQEGRVERGDYIFMFAVGAAFQYVMTLIRY